MKLMDAVVLAVLVIVCLGVGFIGSATTVQNIPTWFANLNKPFFAPPNWLFGPVWTLLYIFMGVAAFLVWQKGIKNNSVRVALLIFLVQLILNAVWTPLFFGLHWLLIAFIELVVLWLFILWNIITFYRVSPAAGLILLPYILWVSFASVLNFSIWWLNR
jgi:tryptophan-rich sensory protein